MPRGAAMSLLPLRIEWPKSNLVNERKVVPGQDANAHCILTLIILCYAALPICVCAGWDQCGSNAAGPPTVGARM